MYETRLQSAASQDENITHRASKATHLLHKGAINVQNNHNMSKGQLVPGGNRRALGEIGNLVGALSARCTVSKDGLRQHHGNLPKVAPSGNIGRPVQRPITRKFGADIANNTQLPVLKHEELGSQIPQNEVSMSWRTKQRRTMGHPSAAATRCKLPTVRSTQATEESASLPTTYAQQRIFKAPSNHGMLAVKKKTTLTATLTARSEAACGGFEVEMEEAEEPLPDIDAHDVGNQLAVVDYVEDIYAFYRKTEIQSCVPPEYMTRQCDINEKMRAILIDWLIEVHLKFKLMPETFLTINLIDRLLACHIVVRKNLQLIGVTAVLLASKYEEIWSPEVDDFVFISDRAYTREQVLNMEKQMLSKLRFNLTVPTPYVFLVRFLKAATSDTDTQLEMLAFFLTELCLTEYGMMKYCPSVLAAAAVYTAQHTLKRSPCWSTTLQRHSGYTKMHLRNPNTYDPERFAPGREEDKAAGAFSYLSFGGGRHGCLGSLSLSLSLSLDCVRVHAAPLISKKTIHFMRREEDIVLFARVWGDRGHKWGQFNRARHPSIYIEATQASPLPLPKNYKDHVAVQNPSWL